MVNFIVIRHGLSQSNREKRFSGQYDTPLSDFGVRQAECSCEYVLKSFKVDMVVASDLQRAYNTVKPAADALSVNIDKYKELREVDVGSWLHVPYAEIDKFDPEGRRKYLETPIGERVYGGAESYTDVKRRAIRKLREIAEENDGKTILVGTHAGVVRVFLVECLGMDINDMESLPGIHNASVTTATYENGKFTLVEAGCKKHLEEAGLLKE
ncbi:MAG: histidine phosphatase family protein [Clostridia bacterium]|nr:histidine phosphatase family protein [Clostridia bacterium]